MRCSICASGCRAFMMNLRKHEGTNMTRRGKLILIAPAAIVGIALFIFLGGWLVMHLWNWLLPALFGWRLINFWQALAMLVLCRILFGGVSGRGMHRRHNGRRMGCLLYTSPSPRDGLLSR